MINWEALLEWQAWLGLALFVLGLGYLIWAGSWRKRVVWLYFVLAGPLHLVIYTCFYNVWKRSESGLEYCIPVFLILLGLNACLKRILKQTTGRQASWCELAAVALCSDVLFYLAILFHVMIRVNMGKSI